MNKNIGKFINDKYNCDDDTKRHFAKAGLDSSCKQ